MNGQTKVRDWYRILFYILFERDKLAKRIGVSVAIPRSPETALKGVKVI